MGEPQYFNTCAICASKISYARRIKLAQPIQHKKILSLPYYLYKIKSVLQTHSNPNCNVKNFDECGMCNFAVYHIKKRILDQSEPKLHS